MWTLYGSVGSGSAAIELALRRCGVPYREVRASTWEADSARDELAAANPLSQIPTLVDPSGMVMTESAAMLIHLGLVFPGSGLLPADESARAQAMRGLVYVAANCYAAIGVIDYPERWLGDADDAALQQLRQGARSRLHACWDVFADQFGGALLSPDAPRHSPAAWPRPAALDMLTAVVSRWAGARAHLAQSRPSLAAALASLDAHPEFLPVFKRHWPELFAS